MAAAQMRCESVSSVSWCEGECSRSARQERSTRVKKRVIPRLTRPSGRERRPPTGHHPSALRRPDGRGSIMQRVAFLSAAQPAPQFRARRRVIDERRSALQRRGSRDLFEQVLAKLRSTTVRLIIRHIIRFTLRAHALTKSFVACARQTSFCSLLYLPLKATILGKSGLHLFPECNFLIKK